MTRLEALNDLYNPQHYGRVRAGDTFSVRDSVAEKLIKQGSARRIVYETKVITPEVQTLEAEPFRYLPLPHVQPAAVAPESNRVLPESDLPEQRASDRGKRSGRKTSDSER